MHGLRGLHGVEIFTFDFYQLLLTMEHQSFAQWSHDIDRDEIEQYLPYLHLPVKRWNQRLWCLNVPWCIELYISMNWLLIGEPNHWSCNGCFSVLGGRKWVRFNTIQKGPQNCTIVWHEGRSNLFKTILNLYFNSWSRWSRFLSVLGPEAGDSTRLYPVTKLFWCRALSWRARQLKAGHRNSVIIQ